MPPRKGFFINVNRVEYANYLRRLENTIQAYFEKEVCGPVLERAAKGEGGVVIGGISFTREEFFDQVTVPFYAWLVRPRDTHRYLNEEGEPQAKKVLLEREELIAKLPGAKPPARPEVIENWINPKPVEG